MQDEQTNYANNKSCDQISQEEANKMEQEEKEKLQNCKTADDINYDDIMNNASLSEEDKQKLKAKRFELFQSIQDK